MNILRAYDAAINRNPILVKSLTSAVLFGAGDFLSQKLEGKKSLDVSRMARMVAWGTGFGVLAHGWYTVIVERYIRFQGPTGVIAKVVSDQVRVQDGSLQSATRNDDDRSAVAIRR